MFQLLCESLANGEYRFHCGWKRREPGSRFVPVMRGPGRNELALNEQGIRNCVLPARNLAFALVGLQIFFCITTNNLVILNFGKAEVFFRII